MSRIDKSTGEKNRLVVAGAEGLSMKWAGGVVNVKEYPISFVHGENVLKLNFGPWSYNSVNILKITSEYTINQ